MKITEIEELWKIDSEINDVAYDIESDKTHKLHHKYFTILNDEKKAFLKLEAQYKSLRLDKYEYYTGTLDQERLKERNWLPFGIKILKSNVNMYIDADKDILNDEYRIGLQMQKLEFLKSIIDQINRRSFVIKNSIEWRKYTSGVV